MRIEHAVVVGASGGIGGAIALRDSMASFMFGVPTSDPLSFVVAALTQWDEYDPARLD